MKNEILRKKILIRIIAALLVVNLTGLELHYFGYEAYFIFMGFRFHISLAVPLFFLINSSLWEDLKIFFTSAVRYRFVKSFLLLFVPILAILTSGLMTGLLEIGKPDFFYELGLSSVVDFPLYFIWNLPQLFLLSSFLLLLKHKYLLSSQNIFLIITALFLHEFYPVNQKLNWIEIPAFLSAVLFNTALINYPDSVFRISIFIFFPLWIFILAFGSSNKILINLFLASQYEQWEGFISSPVIVPEVLFIIQFLIGALLIYFYKRSGMSGKMS